MKSSDFFAATMNAFQIFRAIVPIDTGNLRYNATEYLTGGQEVRIRVNGNGKAPYAVYTNEPWIAPRWGGKKNPNEGWVQGGVELVAMYLAQQFGGELTKKEGAEE